MRCVMPRFGSVSSAWPTRNIRPAPEFPAWIAAGSDEVVADTVVARSSAASAYAGVLDRELFRTLRQEGGWSYQVGAV